MSINTLKSFQKTTSELAKKESFGMSGSAFKLFIALNGFELNKQDCLMYDRDIGLYGFLCTDAEIRELTGMNIKTIQKAKKELKEHNFICVKRGEWHYKASGKSDIKQPCKYFILK